MKVIYFIIDIEKNKAKVSLKEQYYFEFIYSILFCYSLMTSKFDEVINVFFSIFFGSESHSAFMGNSYMSLMSISAKF